MISAKWFAQKEACKEEDKDRRGEDNDGSVGHADVLQGVELEEEGGAAEEAAEEHPQAEPPAGRAEERVTGVEDQRNGHQENAWKTEGKRSLS